MIYGTPIRERDTLEDYLYKDGRENLSLIVNATFPDAKKAILNYRHCSTLMVLEEGEEVSLMEIELLTGRHHQIRAQMSNAGMPLLGDRKYGSDRSKELSRDIGCKKMLHYVPISLALSIRLPIRKWSLRRNRKRSCLIPF